MSDVFPPPADAARLLQEYLEHSIPLVAQMQVRVVELNDDALALRAPLAPNRNHIGTVFGGSLNALATLSCWGLVWLALHGRGAQIVVHEGRMKFRKPATTDFLATCPVPRNESLEDFVAQFERRGRARIALRADIACDGKVVAEFEGTFAALTAKRTDT